VCRRGQDAGTSVARRLCWRTLVARHICCVPVSLLTILPFLHHVSALLPSCGISWNEHARLQWRICITAALTRAMAAAAAEGVGGQVYSPNHPLHVAFMRILTQSLSCTARLQLRQKEWDAAQRDKELAKQRQVCLAHLPRLQPVRPLSIHPLRTWSRSPPSAPSSPDGPRPCWTLIPGCSQLGLFGLFLDK
jgi:hypothetical protein